VAKTRACATSRCKTGSRRHKKRQPKQKQRHRAQVAARACSHTLVGTLAPTHSRHALCTAIDPLAIAVSLTGTKRECTRINTWAKPFEEGGKAYGHIIGEVADSRLVEPSNLVSTYNC
jgi:hypothetical protein